MDIYTQTIPYFYIIRNKETGIMYAGSKWAKGCNPDTFMIPLGYQTSSPIIHSIIEEFGLDIFEILRLDTYCDGLHVFEYETIFLQTNECSKSIRWYNTHNNTGKMAFGTELFDKKKDEVILEKYGVLNVMQNEEIKRKMKQTTLMNNNVDHNSKIEKMCCFCGEIKNIRHEARCLKNPNRYTPDFSKDKNPSAKKFKIISPENVEYIVFGGLQDFYETHNLTKYKLKRPEKFGWVKIQIQ
nr:MAG: hypothetical protein [Caudoviricetes sp.]